MSKTAKRIFFIAYGLLIGAGVGLRFCFWNISYEYDEIFTAVTADPSLPLSWIWKHWLLVDVHPPLHNILLWLYNHFAPYGPEAWMRFPSVLMGLWSLVLAWCLFPKRWGKTARLMFTAMLATQAYGIFYAQHARPYALLQCLSVPFLFLFLNISRLVRKNKKISAGTWSCFALLSLLLCWSHYFGALLFGVCSVWLLVQAVWYRRRIAAFVLVPGAVFCLFLPWLIPNLQANLALHRFSGAWWANSMPHPRLFPSLVVFFFSSFWGGWALAGVAAASWWFSVRRYRRTGRFAFKREMLLLAAVLASAALIAALLSLKVYLLFGRYFMGFVPFVYLLIVFLLLPLCRRSRLASLAFVFFLASSAHMAVGFWQVTARTAFLPARLSMYSFVKRWPEKELFVVAMEAFPPASMEAMYGFYPNRVFGKNVRVTELWQMDEKTREAALARRDAAVIWMPNCSEKKLGLLSKTWERAVGVEAKVGNTCFIRLTEKGNFEPPAQWGAVRKSGGERI